MSSEFTNWDRFKDSKQICDKLGCGSDSQFYCCPDLMGMLCKPKYGALQKIKITEHQLDGNIVSVEEVNNKIIKEMK